MQHNGRRIEKAITFLSRELAQTKPDTTVALSVISGSSVLAFTKFSDALRARADVVEFRIAPTGD